MAAKLQNESLTTAEFVYVVPINCVSVAFYVASGSVIMTLDSDSGSPQWSGLTAGSKEAFNGDAARGIRGETFIFSAASTAELEIRLVTTEDLTD